MGAKLYRYTLRHQFVNALFPHSVLLVALAPALLAQTLQRGAAEFAGFVLAHEGMCSQQVGSKAKGMCTSA